LKEKINNTTYTPLPLLSSHHYGNEAPWVRTLSAQIPRLHEKHMWHLHMWHLQEISIRHQSWWPWVTVYQQFWKLFISRV